LSCEGIINYAAFSRPWPVPILIMLFTLFFSFFSFPVLQEPTKRPTFRALQNRMEEMVTGDSDYAAVITGK
jgi:hypothetical protein